MPQETEIEWTATYLPDGTIEKGYTSNPIYALNRETGKRGWFCVKVSPGCGHCYAETLNVGRFGNKLAFTETNLEKVEFILNENELIKILKLNNRLAKKGKTAKLFLGDMTDIFQPSISDHWLNLIFVVVALCPNITFQILTKRADRMRDYFKEPFRLLDCIDWLWEHNSAMANNLMIWATSCGDDVLQNLHLGVSVENQKAADERIPLLLETPAAVRFLSCEPLLAEINLDRIYNKENLLLFNSLEETIGSNDSGQFVRPKIDWVIVGGESGNGARPCSIDSIYSIVRQCAASGGTPVFVKQLGSNSTASYYDHYARNYTEEKGLDWECVGWDIRDGQPPMDAQAKFPVTGKGGNFEDFPVGVRVREFPQI